MTGTIFLQNKYLHFMNKSTLLLFLEEYFLFCVVLVLLLKQTILILLPSLSSCGASKYTFGKTGLLFLRPRPGSSSSDPGHLDSCLVRAPIALTAELRVVVGISTTTEQPWVSVRIPQDAWGQERTGGPAEHFSGEHCPALQRWVLL